MVKPTINSSKHYIPLTNSELATGALLEFDIVEGQTNVNLSATADVREGSNVKAIFLELWCAGAGASGTDTQFTAIVVIQPSNAPSVTTTNLANLQSFKNKKNVLYTTQGVLRGLDVQAVPIIRQWFKIPKGKQRIGLGDKIQLYLTSIGTGMNRCGFATYKEYY